MSLLIKYNLEKIRKALRWLAKNEMKTESDAIQKFKLNGTESSMLEDYTQPFTPEEDEANFGCLSFNVKLIGPIRKEDK